MFERYTENARRMFFFAFREATAIGSPTIDPGHLVLGILEADPERLAYLFAGPITPEVLHSRLSAQMGVHDRGSVSVDRPLSNASKQVLFSAMEEADRRHDQHIGTEHLLAGLLHDEQDSTAKVLRELAVEGKAGAGDDISEPRLNDSVPPSEEI